MTESPSSTQTYRSEPGGGPADPTVRRFVMLAIIFGMVLTIALVGRQEVSRWHQANAMNAYAEQRYADTVEAANKALEWDPNNDAMINLRALARMRNDDLEGSVADLDALIAAEAENDEAMEGRDERDIELLAQKAHAVQLLGRHAEVQAIWDDIVAYRQDEFFKRDDDESRYAYAMALNNRAYMTAQAYTATSDKQFDVAAALEQSRKSIELLRLDDDPVTLDTLGYLLLLNGKANEAVEHLEKAVKLTQAEQDATRKRMRQATDQRLSQDFLATLDNQFAVILHHRGEAYAAVGEMEKSESDIQEALRLGYNPEEGIW